MISVILDLSSWVKRQKDGPAPSSQEGKSEDQYCGPANWESAVMADRQRDAQLVHWKWGGYFKSFRTIS